MGRFSKMKKPFHSFSAGFTTMRAITVTLFLSSVRSSSARAQRPDRWRNRVGRGVGVVVRRRGPVLFPLHERLAFALVCVGVALHRVRLERARRVLQQLVTPDRDHAQARAASRFLTIDL